MSIPLDLALDDDFDLVVTDDLALVYDLEGIAQILKISLSIFLGEWYLDLTDGIDYWGQIFVKDPNIPAIREMFRQRMLASPGVKEVVSLDFQVSSDRSATLKYVVQTDLGLLTDSVTQTVQ